MAAFEQFLNDKYLSALHSPLLSTYRPGSAAERDKFELEAMSDNPTLLDFVGSTPAPVTKVLVDFASVIYEAKQLVFAASWRGSSEQSFLLLFTWWALCLYGHLFLRYGLLPLLILGPVIGYYLPSRWKAQKLTPTTEGALALSLSYLDAIHALKPDVTLHDPLPPELTIPQRLRILAFILPPYIGLTFWVPLRVLVAVAGTAILTYRSPWVVTTRRILSRSAYMRAGWRYTVGWLSGTTPLPLPTLSRTKTLGTSDSKTSLKEEPQVRQHSFIFTVLENQRWWVGIDWTAALLPSERPSWCAPISNNAQTLGPPNSQSQYIPLPPPASFPLPAPTSVTLPSPTGKGWIKRTAQWQWEEQGEWEVLVHKEGERGVKKLRVPVKAPVGEDGSPKEPKGSVLAKAAGKFQAVSSPTMQSFNDNEVSPTSKAPANAPAHSETEFTDQDGWIYGDNKWESISAKGGMGKFTRFRRWCRVAILVETEGMVDSAEENPGPAFVRTEEPAPLVTEKIKTKGTTSISRSRGNSTKSDATGSPERVRGRTIDEGSLQNRLKAALKSGS